MIGNRIFVCLLLQLRFGMESCLAICRIARVHVLASKADEKNMNDADQDGPDHCQIFETFMRAMFCLVSPPLYLSSPSLY